MNRRVRIPVNVELITGMLTEGFYCDSVRCIKGLPEGARFVNMAYDPMYNRFHLIFEHESLEPVEDGEMLPIMTPMFENVR